MELISQPILSNLRLLIFQFYEFYYERQVAPFASLHFFSLLRYPARRRNMFEPDKRYANFITFSSKHYHH